MFLSYRKRCDSKTSNFKRDTVGYVKRDAKADAKADAEAGKKL